MEVEEGVGDDDSGKGGDDEGVDRKTDGTTLSRSNSIIISPVQLFKTQQIKEEG